jgi:hypothetical protein
MYIDLANNFSFAGCFYKPWGPSRDGVKFVRRKLSNVPLGNSAERLDDPGALDRFCDFCALSHGALPNLRTPAVGRTAACFGKRRHSVMHITRMKLPTGKGTMSKSIVARWLILRRANISRSPGSISRGFFLRSRCRHDRPCKTLQVSQNATGQ